MAQLLLLFSPLPCIPLTWRSNAHGCAISLSQRSSSIINFNFINHHQFPKARVQTCKFCYSHPQMRPHWERSEQCTNDFVPKISTLLKSMAHNFAWKISTRSNDLCYMGEHIQCYRLLGCYHVTVWNNSCYSHQKLQQKYVDLKFCMMVEDDMDYHFCCIFWSLWQPLFQTVTW